MVFGFVRVRYTRVSCPSARARAVSFTQRYVILTRFVRVHNTIIRLIVIVLIILL